MRFEFYHPGLDDAPKLSVDGTVANSIHFSHWEGNETPAELKADTSTEIALNLVSSFNRSELTRGIELVTNNHFDTDGVLSVWTVLTGERALELRELLVPAAEAGDFCEFKSEAAVRASIVIQGSDQPAPGEETGSPIASYLARERVDDDAQAYNLVLPEVQRILTKTYDYEHLWRDAWGKTATALESFERGASNVTEFPDAGLSLVTLAPEVFGPNGFNSTLHAAPYTAISSYAKGRLFLITTPVGGGWAYRIDYPYYSWAETIVRPRIERHDFSELLAQLNRAETQTGGLWKFDNREMTSAIKFLDGEGRLTASLLAPEYVSTVLRTALLIEQPAKTLHA
ncbi:MAG: DUF6687 family protein [Acidobacteriota bacterium]